MFSLQKRIDDLKGERKTVKNQIAVAEGELKKTEDLVKMLSDSKTVNFTNVQRIFLNHIGHLKGFLSFFCP